MSGVRRFLSRREKSPSVRQARGEHHHHHHHQQKEPAAEPRKVRSLYLYYFSEFMPGQDVRGVVLPLRLAAVLYAHANNRRPAQRGCSAVYRRSTIVVGCSTRLACHQLCVLRDRRLGFERCRLYRRPTIHRATRCLVFLPNKADLSFYSPPNPAISLESSLRTSTRTTRTTTPTSK